ncbi:MAG TPA: Gfo/Idh/MocA family oxidoreductase [Candidatus Eremiobacteraceae bacterium]|nr:Gfo/Idh/MocA family oxidoreductase [Candidatus Eremiobacteraceae bacterium]
MKQVAVVAGLGFVGKAHVDGLRRLGIEVRGALGSSPESAAASCKELGLDRPYSSVDELAEDAAVTVVHLCTPNHLHFSHASLLLRAGKHILCEKPLALDSREAELLVKIAKESGRVGGVAYNLRYYPLCHEARALIKKGAIGEPRLVHGSFLQDWLLHPTDWNWRLDPKLGGQLRAVSDIGTHWLDLTTWITQKKITEVCADLATVIPVRHKPVGRVVTFQKATGKTEEVHMTTDDYATVLLHFEGNLRGAMTVSQVSAGRKARLSFEIDGTEGSLAWNSEEPNMLWIGRRDTPSELFPKDPALMTPETRGYAVYPGGHTEGYGDTFMQLFRDFYGYLDAGDLTAPRHFPTFQTGNEELLLCEAIEKSSQDRSWVSLDGN